VNELAGGIIEGMDVLIASGFVVAAVAILGAAFILIQTWGKRELNKPFTVLLMIAVAAGCFSLVIGLIREVLN